ncbi:MAG: GNAT family N-acetyltransferase [Planctomycetota bacterium]
MNPTSPRLRYRRLSAETLDAFWALATDAHVRRWLLDGERVDRAWCAHTLAASDRLFATLGLGLWLVHLPDGAPIGFAGFHVFAECGPEPQLLYALLEAHTGQGLATEIGRAVLDRAAELGIRRVASTVDAPNVASLRVLEKLGFRPTGELPGAFGVMHTLELALDPPD